MSNKLSKGLCLGSKASRVFQPKGIISSNGKDNLKKSRLLYAFCKEKVIYKCKTIKNKGKNDNILTTFCFVQMIIQIWRKGEPKVILPQLFHLGGLS